MAPIVQSHITKMVLPILENNIEINGRRNTEKRYF